MATWLAHSQLWDTVEETASLTQFQSMNLILDLTHRLMGSLQQGWTLKPGQVPREV